MCLLTESCHQLRQCLTLLLLLALLLWYCSWTWSLSHGWFLGWWWRSVMVCFYNFYMVEKPSGAAFLCPLLLHTRGLSDSLSPLEATCVTTWNEGTAASWLACYFQWLSLTTGVNLLNLGNTYCLPRMRLTSSWFQKQWNNLHKAQEERHHVKIWRTPCASRRVWKMIQ